MLSKSNIKKVSDTGKHTTQVEPVTTGCVQFDETTRGVKYKGGRKRLMTAELNTYTLINIQ
jgi:hypothetical protein